MSHARTVQTLHPIDPFEVLGTGWEPCGPSTANPYAGRPHVTPLAYRGATTALLWSAAAETSVPAFGDRRSVFMELALDGGVEATVLIFADAARTEFVCSFERLGYGAVTRYVEYRAPERLTSIHRELRRLGEGKVGAVSSMPDPGRARILRWIGKRIGMSRGDVRLQEVVDAIGGLGDPLAIRRFWRALSDLSILDPDAADGEWLRGAAVLLEPIYLAALDRIRVVLDDGARQGRRRPEYLSDFRRLIRLAEDARRYATSEHFARRLLLQRNLYGVCGSQADLAECRSRLLSHADSGSRGIPTLDLNLVLGGAGKGRETGGPAGADYELREEGEILGTVLSSLREQRVAADRPFDQLERASEDLDGRRRRWVKRRSTMPPGVVFLLPAGAEHRFSIVRGVQ